MIASELRKTKIAGSEPVPDRGKEIFLAELLRAAAQPRICSIIEEAQSKHTAIWGAHAGFGKYVKSTYFPLLLCNQDQQDRPLAVYLAAKAGNTRVAELYCQSIGLGEFYSPPIPPRIRCNQWREDWRCSLMVIEIIAEMGWLDATHDRNAYVRAATLRALQNRLVEEEREHVKAGQAGQEIKGLEEEHEAEQHSSSIRAFEFRSDFESAVMHANKVGTVAEEFDRIMRDLVLTGATWAQIAERNDVPERHHKHFSTNFVRAYEPKLRCFRERMSSYHRPQHRTDDERQAAAYRNRASALASTMS